MNGTPTKALGLAQAVAVTAAMACLAGCGGGGDDASPVADVPAVAYRPLPQHRLEPVSLRIGGESPSLRAELDAMNARLNGLAAEVAQLRQRLAADTRDSAINESARHAAPSTRTQD